MRFTPVCVGIHVGNMILAELTAVQPYTIRFDLYDWEGRSVWAEYPNFVIEGSYYTISSSLGPYNGTAGKLYCYIAD